jgi:hypothetical protein
MMSFDLLDMPFRLPQRANHPQGAWNPQPTRQLHAVQKRAELRLKTRRARVNFLIATRDDGDGTGPPALWRAAKLSVSMETAFKAEIAQRLDHERPGPAKNGTCATGPGPRTYSQRLSPFRSMFPRTGGERDLLGVRA